MFFRYLPGLLLPLLVLASCGDGSQGAAGTVEGKGTAESEQAPADETFERGALRVTVVNEQGEGLADVRILVENRTGRRSGERAAEAMTDAKGGIVLTGLPDGRYRVSIAEVPGLEQAFELLPDGSRSHQREVKLSSDAKETATVDFVLESGGGLLVDVNRGNLATDARTTVSLRRYWPDGVLRPLARVPRPEVREIREETGARDIFRYGGLPAGRYLVRVSATDRCRVFSTTMVAPGTVSKCSMTVGAPGEPVGLTYMGPIPEGKTGCRVNLNGWDGTAARHVVYRRLVPGAEPVEVRSLPPGRYVAILWDQGLAMAVDLRDRRDVVLVPPVRSPGDASGTTVTVKLSKGGELLLRMFVGLSPVAEDPLAHGQWMRYSESWPTARFENVPPGRYTVVVPDGVMGVEAGIPSPTTRTIEVGSEPLEIEVELP